MKCVSVRMAVLVCLTIWMTLAKGNAAECPAYIPAGVVIRVLPDEKLRAGNSSGPTILTVSSDVRFFPNRPPLLARGSKVLGTIVESKEAGRFHGKARLKITLTSILNSDFCEYPIDARIVEAGRQKVADDIIWGRGHAQRDLFGLLFLPTTVYQLVRIPGRGPKLVLDNETPISIKLLQPVSLAETSGRLSEADRIGALAARIDEIERNSSGMKASLGGQISRFQDKQPADAVSELCPTMEATVARPLIQMAKVMRPVRNLTPYHVSVYLDRRQVAVLPPCYGPSMIATPVTQFHLEAVASVPAPQGQRQIPVRVVPSTGGNGWDIVPDSGDRPVISTN